MTKQDVDEYVEEGPDKRSQKDWDGLSLAELLAEWDSRPRYPLGPPYPKDRNRYARLTKVRNEIAVRMNAPDSAKGKKRES